MGRVFNKEVYDKVDKKAKETLEWILMRKGYGILHGSGEELYNTDVVAIRSSGIGRVNFECEVRAKVYWDKIIDGNYKDIHIPARKVRNGNISDWYVIFPDTFDRLLLINMKTVRRSPIHSVQMQSGREDFVFVNRADANLYNILDGEAFRQGPLG